MSTVKISQLEPLGAAPDPADVLIINDGVVTKNITIGDLFSAPDIGTLKISSVEVTASAAEINRLEGVTSNVQTQIDAKQDASTALTTSNYSTTLDTRYYTESEVATFFDGTLAISGYNKTNWDTAYGWGDHSTEGYIVGNQTITLSGDASGSGATSISVSVNNAAQAGKWTTARSIELAGDLSGSVLIDGSDNVTLDATVLSAPAASETDPVFTASAAAGITATNINNWDFAYGWGDHSTQGYLTSAGDIVFSGNIDVQQNLSIDGTGVAKSGMPIIEVASSTFTLLLAYNGAYLRTTSSAAVNVIVPPNSSVAFPIGSEMVIFQAGLGQVTFSASGVTINSVDESLSIATQFQSATLKKVGTDTWDLIGGLA